MGRDQDAITRIPELFPGWHVKELVGRGAFGRVYRASRGDGASSEECAIKVVEIPSNEWEVSALVASGMDALSVRSELEGRARAVLAEVEAMELVKDAPHVVRVEESRLLERTDGVGWTVYVRMELLESLTSVIAREGAPSSRLAAEIGEQICEALNACHAVGMLHRDVKPANIFRDRNGSWRLGDFGLARTIEEGSNSTRSRAGTGDYMAPEILTGHYGKLVDVYSLGVMLYCWLNGGRGLFQSPTDPATHDARLAAEAKRLRGDQPPLPAGEDVDPQLAAIVARAVEPSPANRWSSAKAFGDALQGWLDNKIPDVPECVEKGADVREEVRISTMQAENGCEKRIAYTLPGSDERLSAYVKILPGVTDGTVLHLSGLGVPGSGGGANGDLLVTVRVRGEHNIYCRNCGALIDGNADVCPKCGMVFSPSPTDTGGFGWGLVGFCFPFASLILSLTEDKNSSKRQSATTGAKAFVIILVCLFLLDMCIIIS